ncbi:hypothetical protein GA0061099_10054 [Bradyrhizobium yuanmingense]|uniref:DUF4760 domain-containing protein n=1 Tax=Bradyrhizobium yuanmingense TaxID=108015 RepID=A0A1C3VZU7_9BRAD|nr:hypothetical protein [Bradyrhizobium yuanmingense]TWI27780.1 hypothetical protein IQ15_03320 [Bradyrhizobium yuanmingense]SCB33273.1 hypothetical protein GA0061099_10054 [Bradyrhizobium yuanmingense]
MSEKNWPGIASAVAILWIIATVLWLGIAGPIWQATKTASPDAWIGFAGNALGAGVTLLAATAAAIAAYWTIVPMRRQLSELIRQNSFAHYERLRQRAAELMDMKILIENVTASLEVMHMSLALSGLGANERRQTAFDRLHENAGVLNSARRTLWGDENAQNLTVYFIDNTLRAVNVVRNSLPGSREPFDPGAWLRFKDIAFQGGVALHSRIKLETDVISSEIAALEPVVLNRQPFPQLWKGEYPGPEKLAEMYAARASEQSDASAAPH